MPSLAQKKYRTGVRWVLGTGAIAIASMGGYFAYVSWVGGHGRAVTVPVVTVVRGDVIKTVSAGGTVKVGNQQTLEAPTTADNTAVVAEIEVQVNSAIAAGQTLIRLRNAEGLAQIEQKRLEIANQRLVVAQSQQEVEKTEIALAQMQRLYRQKQMDESEVQTAAIALRKARIELANRQADIPNLQADVTTATTLEAQGYIAANELRTAQKSLRDAQSEIENLMQAVAQAEIAWAQAQLRDRQELEAALVERRTQELAVQKSRQEVASARQELAKLTVQLASTEAQFEDSSLIQATTAGRVLAIHTVVGAVIKQGNPLLTIGDPRREEVELELTTLQAALVQINQPATVTAIGVVTGAFPARVERIDRVARPQTTESRSFFQEGDTGRVQAVVVLAQPSGTLIPGGQVSIDIEVDTAKAVLKVPPQFIQGEGETTFVWIVDAAGRVAKRPVAVGLVGDTETEIQAGLTVGAQVASPPPEVALVAGMIVKPEPFVLAPEAVRP